MSTLNDPARLLDHALEKVLFLESRMEAAEAARDLAAREADRHRRAAERAQTRLTDWQRRATSAEVATEGAQREAHLLRRELESARVAMATSPDETELRRLLHEAEARLERLGRERELWLDRMTTLARLREGGSDELDLGSFIAELRAELMALRRGEVRRPLSVGERLPRPDAAALLEAVPRAAPDAQALITAARVSRPERTLARLCARELDDDSAMVRRRAAERLAEARLAVLNPLVQERLPHEPDATVRAAFVRLLSLTGGEATDLALLRTLSEDPDPRVRTAALEALPHGTETPLRMALEDPSPAVRRRALGRLPRTAPATDRLADALHDPDPSVRRVAVRLLCARQGRHAESLLQVAAALSDPAVHQAARDELVRRGITPQPPAFTAGQTSLEVLEALQEMTEPEPPPPETMEETSADTNANVDPWPESEHIEPAADVTVEPAAAFDSTLARLVEDEIRTSLRGRTIEELTGRLGVSAGEIDTCVSALVSEGQLIWRGRKLYLP